MGPTPPRPGTTDDDTTADDERVDEPPAEVATAAADDGLIDDLDATMSKAAALHRSDGSNLTRRQSTILTVVTMVGLCVPAAVMMMVLVSAAGLDDGPLWSVVSAAAVAGACAFWLITRQHRSRLVGHT